MKNVAITTFISHNFGTCLQAFALKRAVEKLRFSPVVVTSRKIGSPPPKKTGKHCYMSNSWFAKEIRAYKIYKIPKSKEILGFKRCSISSICTRLPAGTE